MVATVSLSRPAAEKDTDVIEGCAGYSWGPGARVLLEMRGTELPAGGAPSALLGAGNAVPLQCR